MGLFDRFKATPIDHAILGRLERSASRWRGVVTLPDHEQSRLILAGNKEGPGQDGVDLAVALLEKWSSLRPVIEQALFEHYEPYREAFKEDESQEADEDFPSISSAEETWQNVSIVAVTVGDFAGEGLGVEIALETSWDIEHTLGARFSRNWDFIELCGSI